MLKLSIAAAIAAAGLFAAPIAQAASVTYILDPITGSFQTPGTAGTTGPVTVTTTGSIPNVQADPWSGTGAAGVGTYTSVYGGGAATYDIKPTKTVSFIWGSPDSWNTLAFYNNGTLVDSITGSSIVTQANLGYVAAYVTLTTESVFDRLTFSSSTNSFEYAFPAEYVAPVPVPAAGLLAAGGIAALAGLKRRRKA